MKRLVVGLLAGSLVLMLLPGVAAAKSPNDQATGSGQIEALYGENAAFSFSAKSGPNGEDAKGNLNLRRTVGYTELNGKAEVHCLFVVGNEAVIRGEFKGDPDSWPFGPGFSYSIVYVQDNGQPNGEVADMGVAYGVTGGDCESWLGWSRLSAKPLLKGNAVVKNAD